MMVVMIVMTTKCCVYAMQLTLEQGDKHWTGGRMNFELLQLHSLALERVDGSNVCELFPVLHFCTQILKETLSWQLDLGQIWNPSKLGPFFAFCLEL